MLRRSSTCVSPKRSLAKLLRGFLEPGHKIPCFGLARSGHLDCIDVSAINRAKGCDQSGACDLSRNQMPRGNRDTKAVECRLDGHMVMIENPGCGGRKAHAFAGCTHPFLPHMWARPRLQSRQGAHVLNPIRQKRRRHDQRQLLGEKWRAILGKLGLGRQNKNPGINMDVRLPGVGGKTDIILGVAGGEFMKARNKPAHGKGAKAGDIQNVSIAPADDAQGILDLIKSRGQGKAEDTTFGGEFWAIARAFKQRHTHEILKMTYMAADRPMCYAQFVGGS